jgi:hypothetical protein
MSGRYEFEVPDCSVTFKADRLRRDHHELIGELTVTCGLPGARSVNGCLNVADFNFSSLRARQDRAKLLKERARTDGAIDWFGFLEEFCQRIFEAERKGNPVVDLRTLPRPEKDDQIKIDRLVFPRRHPSILFGDGGAAKSYTALYVAGRLAQSGFTVLLNDWELAGEDHRERLERLFGAEMPKILYNRCERRLTVEADSIQRIVHDNKVDYSIFDSIAPACGGRPEEAEIASDYFRVIRETDCSPSLHIAHINKSDSGDQKPFGSSFWHNLARSTWFVQAAEQGADNVLKLGFFNRKSNLGPLHQPFSYTVRFTEDKTEFRRADISETPEFATKLTVRLRMRHFLRHGARTLHEITTGIDADIETIKRTRRRYEDEFIVLEDGRLGLTEKAQ